MNIIKEYLNAIIGLSVLAALVVTYLGFRSYSESLREEGRVEIRAEWQAAENRALINLVDRNAELTNRLTEATNAYTITSHALVAGRAAAVSSGQRVRSAVPTGGELDQRLAASECSVSRAFAARAFRAAQSCRDDIAEVGLGTGGLVESSASAHYEHARADALMQFSMPKSPFKKDAP